MDEYFSNYIKELDEQHKIILEQLKQKKELLRQLETEYYNFSNSRRESLSREIYALRSEPNPDIEKIQKLQEELETLPTREQLENEIEKLKREIEQLQNEFINKPFILPESTLTPLISFKVDIDGKFLVMGNDGKYYVKEDLHGTALNNYKIETDPNTGLPIRETWVMQGSDTFGYPLVFTRELKINNPTIEVVKPIKREIVKEIPEYKEVKISKFVPSMQCVCGWNLTDKLRMVFCPNCGKSLYEVFRKQLEDEMKFEDDREKKNKKKWKLFK
jgi:predicted RNA-binding Zn-ribbon protein involved in translation (DUF1610 family)